MQKAIIGAEGATVEEMSPSEAADLSASQEAMTAWSAANDYKVLRAKAYPPIGDQLDAILKLFEQFRADGNTLSPEMEAVISQWLAVKAAYPKPT